MDDNAVAAFALLCIFGLPILGMILFRVLHFVERLEMIKRGIVPPPDQGFGFGFGRRRAYRMWAEQQRMGGAGDPTAPWQWRQTAQPPPPPPQGQSSSWCAGADDDAQRALFKGIRLALIGFAILIGLSFIGGTPGTSEFRGGPWLLGGLIPMFVGIAQIIIAVLSGAQLPGVAPHATFVPPPPPGPGPGPAAPPPGGPNTWEQPARPHFEELSKPVKPPDIR